MKVGLLITCLLVPLTCSSASASVMDFDDLVIWAGSGSNEAAMVVDWRDGNPALAWGFRWDGAASGEDMLRAIAAEDSNFYASINNTFGFGNFVSGIGYDRDGDGFSVSSGVTFDGDGLFVGATPQDGVSNDADDSYRESTSTFEFWEYFLGAGNPLDGGSWSSAPVGFSGRILSDGDWDAWVFPGFSGNLPSTPLAAGATPVPEPSTMVAFGLLSAGFAFRRFRRRKAKRAVTAEIVS